MKRLAGGVVRTGGHSGAGNTGTNQRERAQRAMTCMGLDAPVADALVIALNVRTGDGPGPVCTSRREADRGVLVRPMRAMAYLHVAARAPTANHTLSDSVTANERLSGHSEIDLQELARHPVLLGAAVAHDEIAGVAPSGRRSTTHGGDGHTRHPRQDGWRTRRVRARRHRRQYGQTEAGAGAGHDTREHRPDLR